MMHYVITRYNLGLYSSEKKDRFGKVIEPNEWMRKRLPLFEQTVKSISEQTNKEFHWIILMDSETDYYDMMEIDRLLNRYKVVNATVLKGHETLKEIIKDNFVYKIQTRLDNDDIIDKDFIKHVKDSAKKMEMIIDTDGIQKDMNGNMYNPNRYYPNSPFITIVSKNIYIYDYEHTHMHDNFKTKVRIHNKLYTQVLHDHNLANKPRGEKI